MCGFKSQRVFTTFSVNVIYLLTILCETFNFWSPIGLSLGTYPCYLYTFSLSLSLLLFFFWSSMFCFVVSLHEEKHTGSVPHTESKPFCSFRPFLSGSGRSLKFSGIILSLMKYYCHSPNEIYTGTHFKMIQIVWEKTLNEPFHLQLDDKYSVLIKADGVYMWAFVEVFCLSMYRGNSQ